MGLRGGIRKIYNVDVSRQAWKVEVEDVFAWIGLILSCFVDGYFSVLILSKY